MALETDTSIGTLLRGALDDARDLFREEVALAKAELQHELSKVAAAGVQFGAAAVMLWFALMFVLVALALGIATLFDWPAWTGFAILAVVLAIGGVIALAGGRRAVRHVQPLPHTIDSIKGTFR